MEIVEKRAHNHRETLRPIYLENYGPTALFFACNLKKIGL
jgi:predicted GIY-YIG superfamily endonuclease